MKQNTRCLVGEEGEFSGATVGTSLAVGLVVPVSPGAISQCSAGSMKQGGYI
jgi:hypothetical protein